MVGPDGIPVFGAAIGIGVGIVWTVVGNNRDRAREVMTRELDSLRRLADEQESDLGELRKAKMAAEKINAVLEVKISRLEAERAKL